MVSQATHRGPAHLPRRVANSLPCRARNRPYRANESLLPLFTTDFRLAALGESGYYSLDPQSVFDPVLSSL